MTVPISGAEREEPTVNTKVALAAEQAAPGGSLVVTVIVTFFPLSLLLGVYVNSKGVEDIEPGLTEPSPFSVILMFVALPPKVPLIFTGASPQVLPLVKTRLIVGPFTHLLP